MEIGFCPVLVDGSGWGICTNLTDYCQSEMALQDPHLARDTGNNMVSTRNRCRFSAKASQLSLAKFLLAFYGVPSFPMERPYLRGLLISLAPFYP